MGRRRRWEFRGCEERGEDVDAVYVERGRWRGMGCENVCLQAQEL